MDTINQSHGHSRLTTVTAVLSISLSLLASAIMIEDPNSTHMIPVVKMINAYMHHHIWVYFCVQSISLGLGYLSLRLSHCPYQEALKRVLIFGACIMLVSIIEVCILNIPGTVGVVIAYCLSVATLFAYMGGLVYFLSRPYTKGYRLNIAAFYFPFIVLCLLPGMAILTGMAILK